STSFAEGRYVVKRFLGEGGKKKVYLAHDELLDRDIAFALIKLEGLDDVGRERITREAQAMGRLGSHPHIVTVLDLGDHEGQPYMVIELLAGGDVEGLIDKATDHKLPLEQAIKIAVEICRGLEFSHSRGIIHRDLKPGNVWLTADGTAKLGDFGLAVATDRSRLTQQGMMVGTVSYMPPEQAIGGEVTPKADLYSLGAMLYEMVAGRPPFLGDDNIAIIGQHINTKAVAPTWHCSDCPRPLETLIMRLLSKNPDDRPENAEAVRLTLEAIDLSTSTRSQEQPFDHANVLEGLADDVFVGRQAEMDQLKAALEDTLSGRGRMVTLVGEPGIGKTRTAQELATYAGLRGCQVLWGRCYEEQGVPPYWPWVQAMRSYVRDTDPDQLRTEMGSGAADIAEIVSDIKTKLPDLDAPPQLDSPEQARFRLFDSITAFLKTASQRKPIMLVLDDLHWSDTPSLMLLQFITREFASSRILLVGAYRDVELNRQHPLAETLGELTRERLFERVLLRGFTQNDVARFIEVTSGIAPPATLVSAVHTQTEGNPLFVTEVVRLLVQEGELTQDRLRDRESWEIRVPEGVREVIGRRLNRLSERCNETLTVAAVVGREFTLKQLDRLIDDMTQDMVLDVLEEALTARLIEELPNAMGQYQFTHALMQETLIDELSLTRRVRLHARIAETLEAMYGEDADSHAAELAHHFAQAEAVLGTEKLVRYSLLAGERALGNFAYEDALVYFQRAEDALKMEPMDDRKAAVLFGVGRAQSAIFGRAQMTVATDNLGRALDYYIESNNLERVLAVAGHHVRESEGITNVWRLLERAVNFVGSDNPEAGRILVRYGMAVGVERGDLEQARDAFDKALVIARSMNDVSLEAEVLASSADVFVRFDLHEEALSNGIKAVELAKQENAPFVEGVARRAILMTAFYRGDVELYRQHIDPLLSTAEKIRHRYLIDMAYFFKIFSLELLGEWEAARGSSNKLLADSPNEPMSLAQRALIEYSTGNFEIGERYINSLIEIMESTPPSSSLEYLILSTTLPIISRIADSTEYLAQGKLAAKTVVQHYVTRQRYFTAHVGLGIIAVLEEDEIAASHSYELLFHFNEKWTMFAISL
ncbi:MAG: protein kinase, partial [Chloroflexi bacterium]|nr:protein kinase [Chloroflexota bacterium]